MADTEQIEHEDPIVREAENMPLNISDGRQLGSKFLEANAKVASLIRKEKWADIILKCVYGIGILVVLGIWMNFVIKFSWKQLNPNVSEIHRVSDTVFVALLTSATANILALPTIILKYLFPKRHT